MAPALDVEGCAAEDLRARRQAVGGGNKKDKNAQQAFGWIPNLHRVLKAILVFASWREIKYIGVTFFGWFCALLAGLMPTKIILADDHRMFREMLLHVLAYKGENCVVMAEAANGTETLDLLGRYLPDLLLLDYKMPGLSRLSVFCKEAVRRSPDTRIIVLSGYSDEDIVLEAALGGAKGYVVKGASVADLLSAIKVVQMGGLWVDPNLSPSAFHAFLKRGRGTHKIGKLSRRELQILSQVAQRMSNKDIGSRLHIDRRTVKNHLTHIFAKLGVSDRQHAARLLFQ